VDENQIAAALIRRCKRGDATAWEDLVRSYTRRIYNICYRFTGSAEDAQDLTQEVFIKVYRTLDSYNAERGSFMTWMATITRNLLVDQFRKSKHDRATESLDTTPREDDDALAHSDRLQDARPSPDTFVQRREAQQQIQRALEKLSPELREAVILRDLQDMDYREIATVLKVPEGTVKSRISRGRTELARLLSRTYKQVT